MRNVDGDVLFRSRKGVGGGVRLCNILTIPPPWFPLLISVGDDRSLNVILEAW